MRDPEKTKHIFSEAREVVLLFFPPGRDSLSLTPNGRNRESSLDRAAGKISGHDQGAAYGGSAGHRDGPGPLTTSSRAGQSWTRGLPAQARLKQTQEREETLRCIRENRVQEKTASQQREGPGRGCVSRVRWLARSRKGYVTSSECRYGCLGKPAEEEGRLLVRAMIWRNGRQGWPCHHAPGISS